MSAGALAILRHAGRGTCTLARATWSRLLQPDLVPRESAAVAPAVSPRTPEQDQPAEHPADHPTLLMSIYDMTSGFFLILGGDPYPSTRLV